ncbi:porin [Paraburkholderia sp. J63]|uniref:porin n=1 Tax=Paraburkholderia sp. J63 TaxID=2805434 RepID=UPI002ABD3823|nr:porin [Paraburkholderia sp. J63]
MSLHPCAAQSSVTMYGLLQDGLEQYHVSGADASSAVRNTASNTSRLATYGAFFGLQGKEDLGAGLKAIFQLESYVFLNGQQPPGFNPLNSRNTRVGLDSARYGTVFFGVWDTPLRDLLSRVPFPGTTFDAGQLLGNGIGNTVGNGQAMGSFERRQTNTVAYWSPVIHGFQARVHYSLNDGSAGGSGAHLLSVRGSYAQGPFTLMAAYETHHDYGGFGTNDRGLALYGDANIGKARVGAMFTQLSYERWVNGGQAGLRVNNWALFGTYLFGFSDINVALIRAGSGSGTMSGLVRTPSGQVAVNPAMYVGQATSGGSTGATLYELGYDYYLSKRTTLFANLMYLCNDKHGSYVPFGGVPTAPGTLGVSETVLALGMMTRF